MSNETFLEKKPYDFVPLVSTCNRENAKSHNNFLSGTYSGRMILNIKTLSPLHIGQGILGFNKGETELTNKTMRRAGKVVIPGSSIKGVIRSIAEAVSHSCAPKVSGKLEEALESGNCNRCNDASDRLCPTCSIFGMVGMGKNCKSYKSKVKFGEFVLSKGMLDYVEIPNLESPFKDYPSPTDIFHKKGYGNERIYYCSACDGRNTGECKKCSKENYFIKRKEAGINRRINFRGRKFYYHNISQQETGNHKRTSYCEVIREDSIFTGSVTFENLTKEELALLAFSLGLDGNFNPKIGYAKPAFYGSIEISVEKVEDLLNRYKKQHNGFDKKFIVDLANSYYDNCDNELKSVINKLRDILDKGKKPIWQEVNGNKVY